MMEWRKRGIRRELIVENGDYSALGRVQDSRKYSFLQLVRDVVDDLN